MLQFGNVQLKIDVEPFCSKPYMWCESTYKRWRKWWGFPFSFTWCPNSIHFPAGVKAQPCISYLASWHQSCRGQRAVQHFRGCFEVPKLRIPQEGGGRGKRDFLTDKGVIFTQLDFSTATAAGPGAALEGSAWPSGVPLISGGSKQSKEPQKGHWDFLQTSTAFFINLQLSALGRLGKWRRKERGEKINPKQNARISLCILRWQEKGTKVWI